MKKKQNYLLEKVVDIFRGQKRGVVLDAGCGDGDYSRRLGELGFQVVAMDVDEQRFKYRSQVEFRKGDVTQPMPFGDDSFDYILFLEVVEHLKDPYTVMQELNRILKEGGNLLLSTPNILNLKSRVRFLVEGAYEFFREPPLDQIHNPKERKYNLHIAPYRFHELEYLLWVSGFRVEGIFTSVYEQRLLFFFWPLLKAQLFFKQRRSLKKGGLDYSRINSILLSPQILYGRHLILKGIKKGRG
jgi:SAM-dependent methyltransferase